MLGVSRDIRHNLFLRLRRCVSLIVRQSHDESGALTLFANGLDLAAVLGDDLASDGQAEPAPRWLGRPHRLKDLFQRAGVNADTRVSENQFDTLIIKVEPCRDLHSPSVRHRVQAIVDEVEKYLV